MKQLKLNNRDYVFVPVPDEWEATSENIFQAISVIMPVCPQFDDFNFIATTDTITEEQAKELGITSNTLAYVGITGRHAIIEKI